MKHWFQSQKGWLKGGIIGALICIALFLFYMFIFFPFFYALHNAGMFGDNPPEWINFIPFVTGHLFVFLLAAFGAPSGFLCQSVVPECVMWSATAGSGGVPWMLETGEAGYCLEQIMAPTQMCAESSAAVVFLGSAFGLVLVYFIVGAVIGMVIEKRKAKKRV